MTTTDSRLVAAPDPPAPLEPDRPSRRGFIRRAGMLGAAVVGAIATTWLDAPSAFAAPGCCNLYYPNGPWCGGKKGVDGFNWSCPKYKKQYWSCHTAHFYYTCWECNSGADCHGGSFACSNYSVTYVP